MCGSFPLSRYSQADNLYFILLFGYLCLYANKFNAQEIIFAVGFVEVH